MSERQDEIVTILKKHEYAPCSEIRPTVSAWWAQCEGCDWRGPRRSHRHADKNDHRLHLAELLSDGSAE